MTLLGLCLLFCQLQLFAGGRFSTQERRHDARRTKTARLTQYQVDGKSLDGSVFSAAEEATHLFISLSTYAFTYLTIYIIYISVCPYININQCQYQYCVFGPRLDYSLRP